jgi:hypothetical protein
MVVLYLLICVVCLYSTYTVVTTKVPDNGNREILKVFYIQKAMQQKIHSLLLQLWLQ